MTTYRPENVIERVGDLFDTDMPAIGHGVNVDGKMGAGVAKIVRKNFPSVYHRYAAECADGALKPGEMLPLQAPDGVWILNLASQDRPGPYARKEWLHTSLLHAFDFARSEGLEGFAIPRIGAGIGGLDWEDACVTINKIAEFYPDVTLEVWSLEADNVKPLGDEYEQLIEAFQIFKKYTSNSAIHLGGNDDVHAGPNPGDVGMEDLSRLRQLGWKINRYDDGFMKTF